MGVNSWTDVLKEWWAGLSVGERCFLQEVDRVSLKLTERQILDFRNRGGEVTVTLVTMRQVPVLQGLGGGRVELN